MPKRMHDNGWRYFVQQRMELVGRPLIQIEVVDISHHFPQVSYNQCDQMARLFFQYLAIYDTENLPL